MRFCNAIPIPEMPPQCSQIIFKPAKEVACYWGEVRSVVRAVRCSRRGHYGGRCWQHRTDEDQEPPDA